MNRNNNITVFEHQSLKIGNGLNEDQFSALQKAYGINGVPYYSLIHNGVKFNEHVGVLQIGNTTIEILPKAEKNISEPTESWREVLIGMLQAVGMFNTQAPSSSSLKLKPNSILDLYFELYINELEYLLRRGLIKKYNKEGNKGAVKGDYFLINTLKNLVHKERFYVSYTNYDKRSSSSSNSFYSFRPIIFYKLQSLLYSRIQKLLLNFPELNKLKVSSSTF